MAVFRRLLLSQMLVVVVVWAAFTALVFVAKQIIGPIPSEVLNFFFAMTPLATLMSTKSLSAHNRFFSVLKMSSKNILSLWTRVLLQNTILIALALGLLWVSAWIIKAPALSLSDIIHRAPFLITIVLFMCMFDGQQIFEKQRALGGRGEIVRQILLMLSALGFVYVCFWIYVAVSPLLSGYLINVAITAWILFFADECVKLLPTRTKWKTLGVVAFVLLILHSIIGVIDLRFSKVPSYVLVPEKSWKPSSAVKITNVDEWIAWQNNLESLEDLSSEEIIKSFDILLTYCKPYPRDNPLEMYCDGTPGLKEYQYTGVRGRSEEEVLKLLSASNEYAQIMGLLYARKIKKPLSRDLILAIEYIAERESSIQLMAKNTLVNSYSPTYADSLVIRTYAE